MISLALMRSVFIICLLACCAFAHAQKNTKQPPKDEPFVCMLPVEPQASPPAGWRTFLERSASITLDSLVGAGKIDAGTYTVKFRFVIDGKGNMVDFVAIDNPYNITTCLVNRLKRYDQKWTPASHNGRNIKAYSQQSVTFIVDEGEEEEEVEEEEKPVSPALSVRNLVIRGRTPAPGCCGDLFHVEQRIMESDANSGHGKPVEETSIPRAHGGVAITAIVDRDKWHRYIYHALDSVMNDHDKIPPGTYTTTINMIFDKDGSLLSATIAADPGYAIAQRFKSIIENYPEKRIPAMQNSRPVKYFCSETLEYKISVEKEGNCNRALLLGQSF